METSPTMSAESVWRYTPSKPLYFRNADVQQMCDLRNERIRKKKELKSLKSLSKMLKKNKQKNKKLKHLWDPSIQVPNLENITKYLKKRKKIDAVTVARECGNSWPEDPKVLARSTTSHRHEPVIENKELQVDNLIDFRTPEGVKPKEMQNNEQLSATLELEKMREMWNLHLEESTFQQLPLTDFSESVEPRRAMSINNDDPSEPGKHEDMAANCSLFSEQGHELTPKSRPSRVEKHDRNSSQTQCETSNQDESASPQVSPEVSGLIDPKEKQHVCVNPSEMLVTRLEKDPFPRPKRKNGEGIVHRRAFSMDDTLINSLFCKPVMNHEPEFRPSEDSDTTNEESLETPQVGNNLVVPIENERHSVENESLDRIEDEGKSSASDEIPSEQGRIQISQDSSAPKSPECIDSAKSSQACSSIQIESGPSASTDVSFVNNTHLNSRCSDICNRSAESCPGEGCKKELDEIEVEPQEQGSLVEGKMIKISTTEEAELKKSSSNFHAVENEICAVDGGIQCLGIAASEVRGNTGTLHVLIPSITHVAVSSGDQGSNESSPTSELHVGIAMDENERNPIPSPPISGPARFSGKDISKGLDVELGYLEPVSSHTVSGLPYSADTTCVDVNHEPRSESPSQTSPKTILGKEPGTISTVDDETKNCQDVTEGLEECSTDAIDVPEDISTPVIRKLEDSFKSDHGSFKNECVQKQESFSRIRNVGSYSGTMHSSDSGSGSERSDDTNDEDEECSANVNCCVPDHNSTYVVGDRNLQESSKSISGDVLTVEGCQDNSSVLSHVLSPTHGTDEEESKTSKVDTMESMEAIDVTLDDYDNDSNFGDQSCVTPLEHWVLPAGKKFRRSLSIIRNLDDHLSTTRRGRHYEKTVEEIIKLQGNNEATTPVQTARKRISLRRSSWLRQITPPPNRRNTLVWSPSMTDRGTLYETPPPRRSIYSTPLQQNVRAGSVRASPKLAPQKSIRPSFNLNCSPESPAQYTIRDLILTICKQNEPCTFSDILNESSFTGGSKLGEGVFGEVFSINRDSEYTVLKIIPIEGQELINGEKQKTYSEVLSELIIAKVLHELRYESSDETNLTSGYAELISTSLVQGSYPQTLLKFWEKFDQLKGSDNDSPTVFGEGQLFVVMEQGNGGKDLESYSFSTAKQSLSIFKQVAFSLAVAEISVEFEHRDLHWGNILVSKTSEKHIPFILNGTRYSIPSGGVKSTIIDYTLSRIKYVNQFPIYNDIGKDPEMFIATGDYQFDVYRLMKKDVDDDWSRFAPKTNARWLHYLLDKILTKVKYQRKTAKVHKDSFKVLEEIGSWIEECESALSAALRLAEIKN